MPETTYGKINTLITETTYAGRHHPTRKAEQDYVMKLIRETEGNILIPAFANNRHQDFQQFL